MTRNVLVVDDNEVNRKLLRRILCAEYNVMEAENGQEALTLLVRQYQVISAVLLDIVMPVMDGYQVLERMRQNPVLSQIPVIVITGSSDKDTERRVLASGANDYVQKPFDADIILRRLGNLIKLRQTAAMVNTLQRDKLTGLWNRETFFDQATWHIARRPEGYYVLSCLDIDGFKVINDQYGTQKGDEVLKRLAKIAQLECDENGGLCGRVSADNFVTLYPAQLVDDRALNRRKREATVIDGLPMPITISIGRYFVDDKSLSVSAMYDRAVIAQATIKGRYDKHVAVYDEEMRDRLLREQEIVTEMNAALDAEQFEPWLQPQYNHLTGALIGAEALVRWRHPRRGLVPPDEFIPVFERNGFVYELDKYIWEQACKCLRRWMDDGRSPLPVSVNISRYDLFQDDLVDTITRITKKYRIAPEQLRLEITESAFAHSTQQVVSVAKRLISLGFTVEIDDFGSGYSSLNTLKDVPAQVLKLDMRFLESSDDSGRGGNILESVVRMTKWLGMAVIAEGVETVAQADFLKSIGCNYMQGYLYAKPMPVKEYEALAKGVAKEEKLIVLETVKNLNNNAFWKPESMDTLIFSSYVGAACIFEYHGGRMELIRVNDKYAQALGNMAIDDVLKLDLNAHIDADSMREVDGAVRRSIETRDEVTSEFVFTNLPGCPEKTYLRSNLRVIATTGDRCLIYCTNDNITAQRAAENKERDADEQLQAIMRNVDGGVAAVAYHGDELRYIFINDRYCTMLGYTQEQFMSELPNGILDRIHPDDLEPVMRATRENEKAFGTASVEFRAYCRDGSMIWIRSSGSVCRMNGYDEPVHIAINYEITQQKETLERIQALNENLQTMMSDTPGGFARMRVLPGGALATEYVNDTLCRIRGMTREQILQNDREDAMATVHPDDRELVRKSIAEMLTTGQTCHLQYRLRHADGSYIPLSVFGRMSRSEDGEMHINAYYADMDEEEKSELSLRETMPYILSATMKHSPDLAFAKDRNFKYICCSPAFVRFTRQKTEADVIGRDDYDFWTKEEADHFRADDVKLYESGEPLVNYVEPIPSDDGIQHYCSTSKYVLRDSTGEIVGLYGIGRDITETREAYAQLRLLINSIPGGIATYEITPKKSRITYFSDGFCRMLGYTREEYEKLAAQSVTSLVLKEDAPMIKAQLKALRSGDAPVNCTVRVRNRSDEGYKWVNLRGVVAERRGDTFVVNTVAQDVTEKQEAIERLRISEEQFRIAAATSGQKIARYDIKTGTYYHNNDKIMLALGFGPEVHNVPQAFVDAGSIAPDCVADYLEFYRKVKRGESCALDSAVKVEDGSYRWVRREATVLRDAKGQPSQAIIVSTDITEQREKEAAYAKWQQSLRERAPESYTMFRCNLGKNAAFDVEEGSLLKIDFSSETMSFDARTLEYAAQYVCPDDRKQYIEALRADTLIADYYRGKRIKTLEYRELMDNGDTRWLRLTAELIVYPNSTDVEAFLMYENIDESKKEELMVRELAENDPLTGVLNRMSFAAKVESAIKEMPLESQSALMMLDMDGFKLLNDGFGHAAGDQALVDVANAIRSVLRHGDLIGRLGGDEFLIFLRDIGSGANIEKKARQLCKLTRRAYSEDVQISASIGIAVCPRDGRSFEVLYHKADVALYAVKGSGKNNLAFFNHQDMNKAETSAEAPKKPDSSIFQRSNPVRRRMLIVDDSAFQADALASLFEDEFIVDKVGDGSSALVRLHHYGSAVSVVLLDLMMEGMDGYEVLDRMRASKEMRSIPVIVVSGCDDREASLGVVKRGAADFVTKPIDPDLLRLRVQSAISKAENERLRAQNSYLMLQGGEIAKYRAVMENTGTVTVEYNYLGGTFAYDPTITKYIAGTYDNRRLWYILLSDSVADVKDVQAMQGLVHDIANDRARMNGGMTVLLKTPSGEKHRFRMNVIKLANEFQLTEKLILTFNDLDESAREE